MGINRIPFFVVVFFSVTETKQAEEESVFSRSQPRDFLCRESFILVRQCQHNSSVQNRMVTDIMLENRTCVEYQSGFMSLWQKYKSRST